MSYKERHFKMEGKINVSRFTIALTIRMTYRLNCGHSDFWYTLPL